MGNNLSQTSQKQKTHIYKETKALNRISDIFWRGSHPLQQNESRLKMAKTHGEHEHWLGPSAPLQHGAGAPHRPDGSRHGLAGRPSPTPCSPGQPARPSGTELQQISSLALQNSSCQAEHPRTNGKVSLQGGTQHTSLQSGRKKDMQETM